jgi:ribA/ribD-fused uncharacterized protein
VINNFRGYHAWLSNMYNCDIEFMNHKFKSVENAYMFAKNPNNEEWLNKCLSMSPGDVKKASKLISIREDWDSVKLSIMYELLKQKFTQEPFRTNLIETRNENIVEGNRWNDTFWGVDIKNTPNVGENWLGRLIMDIRTKIKNGKL